MINQLAIIGLGFTGGSIAKALRKLKFCNSIVGYDTDTVSLHQAYQLNILDSIKQDIPSAIKASDFVVIAPPFHQSVNILKAIKPHLKETAIVTDVCSTKTMGCEIVKQNLGDTFINFVPSYPILGPNHEDINESRAGIFANCPIILTPHKETLQKALQIVEEFWKNLGGKVEFMTPQEYDNILAITSHIPHILAFTFLNSVNTHENQKEILKYIDGDFKHYAEVATCNPILWKDICLANRPAILKEIENFQANLHVLKKILESENGNSLLENFSTVKSHRQEF